MGASECAGLTAAVTGGASGIGLTTARRSPPAGPVRPASTSSPTTCPHRRPAYRPTWPTWPYGWRSRRPHGGAAASTSWSTPLVSAPGAPSRATPTTNGAGSSRSTSSASCECHRPPCRICAAPGARRSSTPGPYLRPQGCPSGPCTHRRRACFSPSSARPPPIQSTPGAEGTVPTPAPPTTVDRPSPGPRRRPGRRAAMGARQPMGRSVTTDDAAGAIAYLASPLSGSTTGTDLAVDGGMHGLRFRPRA